jgi:5-methylcytosine-specific restriction endonuclease McrA
MKGVRVMKDSREICSKTSSGRAEYSRRREDAWDRDRGLCCLCGRFVPLEEATAEHIESRGLGGAKRDDRIPNLAISHWFGNNARGSMSLERYLQNPLEERVRLCQGR